MMKEKLFVSVKEHVKEGSLESDPFSSGFEQVDSYLKNESLFDYKYNVTSTSLIVENNKILAYVTTSVGQLDVEPRHEDDFKSVQKNWPVLFLHELGVDKKQQRKLYGTSMLLEIFKRTLSISKDLQLGIAGIVVHARPEDHVIKFYRKNGFKFLEPKDEKDFGKEPDEGFLPGHLEVPMYITLSKIEYQLELYNIN